MISWQGYILRLYFQLQRRTSGQAGVLNIEAERRNLDGMGRLVKPLSPVQVSPLVVGGIQAEWITPQQIPHERVVLYLHGGSFNAGSLNSHRSLAANVASACKAKALLVDYRLAPEHPFPSAQQDGLAAYEWLLAEGIAPELLLIAGDSAGGTLTLNLLIQLRNEGKPLPAAGVCLSPATDLTMSGDSWKTNAGKDVLLDAWNIRKSIEIYLGEADPHSPLASPLFADLRGLPPILIQVGADEVLLSDAQRFAEKARRAGSPVTLEVWEQMQHVWQFAASLMPEGRQAIDKIGEFAEAVFSRTREESLEAVAYM